MLGNNAQNLGNVDSKHFKLGQAEVGTKEVKIDRALLESDKSKTNENIEENIKFESKKHDIEVLYKMWSLLKKYEMKDEKLRNAGEVLKEVAGLCGGKSGIKFRDDDAKCIRNRYGHNKDEETKYGFINFEQLHRAFMILDANKPAPKNIDKDLGILKSKITYIIISEIKQHSKFLPSLIDKEKWDTVSSQSFEGDENDLKDIYQYVRDNYYSLSILHIKEELKTLQGEVINSKDDLYFFARKTIIIGELCHEIEKDMEKIKNKYLNNTVLMNMLGAFSNINKARNRFVHTANLVVQFIEGNQSTSNREALYENIANLETAINQDEIIEVLKNITTNEAAINRNKGATLSKQAQRRPKVHKQDIIEIKLKESEEYCSLLSYCQSADHSSLSYAEQECLRFGSTPKSKELINLGDKLNIYTKVNNLKMLEASLRHENNLNEDQEYKQSFETIVGQQSFNITSPEDCKKLLEKIATLKPHAVWKLKKEFSSKESFKTLFSRIKNVEGILYQVNERYQTELENKTVYQEVENFRITSLNDLRVALEKFATLEQSKWILHKGKKGNAIFAYMKLKYNSLQTIKNDHDNDNKKSEYAAACNIATEGIEEFDITSRNPILLALNKIADFSEERTWTPTDQKNGKLVQILVSAYNAHMIKDFKVLEPRVRKELEDARAKILKAINEEMHYVLEIDNKEMALSKKQAIREYTVTLLGQYMRELNEISALSQILKSNTACDAGSLMQVLRSKGLAHEVLRFNPEQFEEDFRKIISPAKPDFEALDIIYNIDPIKYFDAYNMLGIAYERLNFYDDAIKQFQLALTIAQDPANQTCLEQYKLNNISMANTSAILIDGIKIMFGIDSYELLVLRNIASTAMAANKSDIPCIKNLVCKITDENFIQKLEEYKTIFIEYESQYGDPSCDPIWFANYLVNKSCSNKNSTLSQEMQKIQDGQKLLYIYKNAREFLDQISIIFNYSAYISFKLFNYNAIPGTLGKAMKHAGKAIEFAGTEERRNQAKLFLAQERQKLGQFDMMKTIDVTSVTSPIDWFIIQFKLAEQKLLEENNITAPLEELNNYLKINQHYFIAKVGDKFLEYQIMLHDLKLKNIGQYGTPTEFEENFELAHKLINENKSRLQGNEYVGYFYSTAVFVYGAKYAHVAIWAKEFNRSFLTKCLKCWKDTTTTMLQNDSNPKKENKEDAQQDKKEEHIQAILSKQEPNDTDGRQIKKETTRFVGLVGQNSKNTSNTKFQEIEKKVLDQFKGVATSSITQANFTLSITGIEEQDLRKFCIHKLRLSEGLFTISPGSNDKEYYISFDRQVKQIFINMETIPKRGV